MGKAIVEGQGDAVLTDVVFIPLIANISPSPRLPVLGLDPRNPGDPVWLVGLILGSSPRTMTMENLGRAKP